MQSHIATYAKQMRRLGHGIPAQKIQCFIFGEYQAPNNYHVYSDVKLLILLINSYDLSNSLCQVWIWFII